MSDGELVPILVALRSCRDDEVWACRRCFLRNGGKSSLAPITKSDISDRVGSSSTAQSTLSDGPGSQLERSSAGKSMIRLKLTFDSRSEL